MAKPQIKTDAIPAPPWTREALGGDLYKELAIKHCGFEPRVNFAPALDLTALYEAQQPSKPTGENSDANDSKHT